LQAEVADLKSGLDAIEERARSELGMIDRDETFYRFVRDRGQAARADAPGVYVEGRKIASLGLRIRHGVSYHGVALNVSMDLEPFSRINPCGYEGLQVTQLSDLASPVVVTEVADQLSQSFQTELLDLAGHRVAGKSQ